MEVLNIAQCLLTILNIQRFTLYCDKVPYCTYIVKEAVLYFLQDFWRWTLIAMTFIRPDIGLIYTFLTAKCINYLEYSAYFNRGF